MLRRQARGCLFWGEPLTAASLGWAVEEISAAPLLSPKEMNRPRTVSKRELWAVKASAIREGCSSKSPDKDSEMGVPWWFVALKEPRERRIGDSESLHSFLEAGFFLWLLWIRVLEEGLGAPVVVRSWQDHRLQHVGPAGQAWEWCLSAWNPKSESTCEGTTLNFPGKI